MRDAEGDDVVFDAREPADESVRADAHELMRRRSAAEDGEISDLAMAGEHDVVGEDDVVADAAIVRDMGVGEKDAARADDRFANRRPPCPDSSSRPSRIRQSSPIVRLHPFAAIFEVLRLVADRGERENARARADFASRRRR